MVASDLSFPCRRRCRRGIHRASSCLRIRFEVEEYFDRRARFVLDLRHHPQRGIRRPVLTHFNVQRRFAEMALAFAKGYRPADFFPRRCKHYFAYVLIIRDNGIGKLHETIRIQPIGDIRFYKTFIRRFRALDFLHFRAQSAIRVKYRDFLRRRALRRDRRCRRGKLIRQLFRRFKGIIPHNRRFFRFGKYAVYVVDLLFQLRFRRFVRQCVVFLYQSAYVFRRGVRHRRHHYIHRVADHVFRVSVRVFPPLHIQIEISVCGKLERYELPLSLFHAMIFADLSFPCRRRSRRRIHCESSCLRIRFEVEEYFYRFARFVLDLRHHPQG